MSDKITRRKFAAWLAASLLASPAAATAPLRSLRPKPRPAPQPFAALRSALSTPSISGKRGCAVCDLAQGGLIENHRGEDTFAPASVTKAITALYALDTLDKDFRFNTTLATAGRVKDGVLTGDLILQGDGDPTLTTDALGKLAKALAKTGLKTITGRFLYATGAYKEIYQIDPQQPAHVGYNPALSGLNLNNNRIFFEWKLKNGRYQTWLEARGLNHRPAVSGVKLVIEKRGAPVFKYSTRSDYEEWNVARSALGKTGGRWLPVRRPAAHTAEVLRSLLKTQGVALPKAEAADMPSAQTVLANYQSDPLAEIIKDMMKYSTNITAEMLGLAATRARGGNIGQLEASAHHMTRWAKARLGMQNSLFIDHSGLGAASRVTPNDMVGALQKALLIWPEFPKLMKKIKPRDARGNLDRASGALILAKTGTLHYVSALAGYVTEGVVRPYAFAIFCQDLEQRQKLLASARETSRNARYWNRRAKQLQQNVLRKWSQKL